MLAQVLQDLLNMIREHQNTGHTARLEWIVIILIGVEIVIGILRASASLVGWALANSCAHHTLDRLSES